MQILPARSRGAAVALLALAGSLAACGSDTVSTKDNPGALPTGFGGAGGAIAAIPSGAAGASPSGGQGGGMTTLAPVCLNVAPGQMAQLDDFEDGDGTALVEQGREGFWYTVKDNTMGSIVPDTDFVATPGGANGSRFAAREQVSGFSDWGALLALGLTYLSDGVRCPYNAKGFAGLRIYVRGSGFMRVALETPATQDKEYGGTCDPAAGMICYDSHTTRIALTDSWTLYELPWSMFKQRGFGTPAALDPGAILALQFAFDAPDLPVDFWLDDVSFWDGKSTPIVSDGDGGSAGASDAAGAGNSAAAGNAAGASGDGNQESAEAGTGGTAGQSQP